MEITDQINVQQTGDERYFSRLRLLGQSFAACVFVLGMITLMGCVLDRPLLRAFWHTGSAAKFNSAFCLCLIGCALSCSPAYLHKFEKFIRAACYFTLVVALLTLVENLTRLNFGIDELIMRDHSTIGTPFPGRMAPQTTIAFIFLAVGVLLLGSNDSRQRFRAQWVALASLPFPVQALVSYSIGHRMVIGFTPDHAYMSVPVAGALILASIAILLHDPDRELMECLTARTHAGSVFRLLLGISIVFPMVIGWLALSVADGRHQPPEYSVATVALVTSLLFVTCIWFQAARLNTAAVALAEREHLYSHYMENLPDIVFRLDRNLRHIYISPMIEKISNIKPAHFIGRTNRDLGLSSPTSDLLEAACRKAFRTRTEESIEYQSNGRIFLTRVIPAARGGVDDTLLGLTTDITRHKRAEAALQASEERYRTLFNSIDEGFCVIEMIFDKNNQPVDYRFLEINPSFEKKSGLANAKGKTMLELAPDLESFWAETYGRVALTGQSIRFQNRAAALGRWFDVYAFRFGEADQRQVAIIFNDITASKETEEALRDTKARLESTLAATKVATWNWDVVNDRVLADASLAKLFSVKAEDASGGKIGLYLNAVHPDDREGVTLAVRAALQDPTGEYEKDYRLIQPDKSIRWVIARGKVERDFQGKPARLSGVIMDITERKSSEEALAKAKIELEQINKNLGATVAERTARLQETVQELEAFSYSIAHDMRSPLRSMVGFSKLLEENHSHQLDETALQYLRRMSSAAHRMDRLIIDILNYSKVVRGELNLHPVDVKKLTTDIIESYPMLQNVQSGITIQEPLPLVLANEAALTQVISNLLGNAVKFVPTGVTPKIFIRAQTGDNIPEGFVRFWFEDNGIGIPKESHDRVFKMFMRLNKPEVYEGTGIGLAIVKRAVERMGGSVGLESDRGQGTRMWVQLQMAGS